MRWLLCLLGGCELVFPLTDDAIPDAGPPTAQCSSTRLFADAFDDTPIAPWFNLRSTRFAVDSGLMTAPVMTNSATAVVEPYFDIRDSSYEVEVASIPSAGADQRVELELVPTADRPFNAVAMRLTGDIIEFGTLTGTPLFETFVPLGMAANDPELRIWKIAHDTAGQRTLFSIGDGSKSKNLYELANVPLTYVRPRLHASAGTPGYTARFGLVNSGVPQGTACSATLLTDEFSAPPLDELRWGRTGGSACTITVEGEAAGPASSTSNWSCQLGSTTVVDLIDHVIDVEIGFSQAGAPSMSVELNVVTEDLQRAGFQLLTSGDLRSFQALTPPNLPSPGDSSTPIQTRTYDPSLHRIWRLSGRKSPQGTSDTLTFETSADGEMFTSFLQTDLLFGLDRVVLTIGAADPQPTATKVILQRITAVKRAP